MSGESSSVVEWFTLLSPLHPFEDLMQRPDDIRLGQVIEPWQGQNSALQPGRPVLIGFPQDEGVRRNRGRPGAAAAPDSIRRRLHRLVPWDGEHDVDLTALPPLDAGNVRVDGKLEDSQAALATVVGEILKTGAVPVVIGGGHEAAFGHFLGYTRTERRVGVINIDAHLDVRPCNEETGNSGTSFRQAIEHKTHPLPGNQYTCLGAQPFSVSRSHSHYAREQGCIVRWAEEVAGKLNQQFSEQCNRLAGLGCSVYLTIDADAVIEADVPGVSAPNPSGLSGTEVMRCARIAGKSAAVSSFDLVEVNPRVDRDDQSSRWAAHVIWSFLAGLDSRNCPQVS